MLKRLKNLSGNCPWGETVGLPGPWLESFSEFTASCAVTEMSILIEKALAGSLRPILGTYFVSPLFYLFACTATGRRMFTLFFLTSGLLPRKVAPSPFPTIFRLQIYTHCPWESLLSPETLGHPFPSAPYTCLSRDVPHSRHHGLFSHLSLLLEGDLHPFRDCVVCSQ